MGRIQLAADIHGQQLLEARQQFFERGNRPEGLVEPVILRSWERCHRFGLTESSEVLTADFLDRTALKTEQNHHRQLLAHGRPIMEHVYEQIRESGSMVILADANGLLLDTVGDPDFVDRADRVALTAGASWDENQRGTNAIGTALVEEAPTEILGAEHFLSHNGFLTCCACPIFGPDGTLIGVLDISGDYRSYQSHTLGLARMSSKFVERRLFEAEHARDILVCFHERADFIGSPTEGISAVSPDGQVIAINQNALTLLGIRRVDAVRRDFSMVFENNLASLIDQARRAPFGIHEIKIGKRNFYLQIRGQLPAQAISGYVYETPPEAISATPAHAPARPQPIMEPLAELNLDTLNAGDPKLQLAIARARRIIGRDIPILIQGESGAGKEIFAKAFHNSGPRQSAPFVALNCAAIPETLIESELFGYQGGAFTGARKEGAPGKIQQAHGGTLFLDEIGDMPLNLQARLLRVLQERSVTPLGSCKSVQVDISLVCATHRKLRDEVALGTFREDLYYRLNGLCVTLPALRERSDIQALATSLALTEARKNGRLDKIRFSASAMQAMETYAWPGNIRQLNNVIRVAIALMDDDENLITEIHLPEELFESPVQPRMTEATPMAFNTSSNGSLEEIGRQAAQNALESAGGNISAAARLLGVSRNTLYRKLGRLG
ncbi:MAG: sigma-54-dependent Fis family transcriptional regulator [Rhodocyclaceae bacterium]|nr:sigma-54-dependent Fis family transcriptional regulator [Rhodocyclaceae bacterium]